jgi:hypothetical protein
MGHPELVRGMTGVTPRMYAGLVASGLEPVLSAVFRSQVHSVTWWFL